MNNKRFVLILLLNICFAELPINDLNTLNTNISTVKPALDRPEIKNYKKPQKGIPHWVTPVLCLSGITMVVYFAYTHQSQYPKLLIGITTVKNMAISGIMAFAYQFQGYLMLVSGVLIIMAFPWLQNTVIPYLAEYYMDLNARWRLFTNPPILLNRYDKEIKIILDKNNEQRVANIAMRAQRGFDTVTLFFGPPGTGKSRLSIDIANAIGADCVKWQFSEVDWGHGTGIKNYFYKLIAERTINAAATSKKAQVLAIDDLPFMAARSIENTPSVNQPTEDYRTFLERMNDTIERYDKKHPNSDRGSISIIANTNMRKEGIDITKAPIDRYDDRDYIDLDVALKSRIHDIIYIGPIVNSADIMINNALTDCFNHTKSRMGNTYNPVSIKKLNTDMIKKLRAKYGNKYTIADNRALLNAINIAFQKSAINQSYNLTQKMFEAICTQCKITNS